MAKNKYINNLDLQLKYVNELLFVNNLVAAREIILDLIKKRPNDSVLFHYLVISYIKNGEYDIAMSLIENEEERINEQLIFDLMSLYIKLGMEENVKKLYFDYFSNIDFDFSNIRTSDLTEMLVYLSNKFNDSFPLSDNEKHPIRMLKKYKKEEVISMIEDIHCGEECNTLFKNQCILNLYDKVEKYVDSNVDKGILCLPVFDSYFFHLDDCGIIDGKNTSYFRVITIVNTSNIITMYPVLYSKYCIYNELEEKKVCDMGKSKVKTGMERFNARYGNNY